MQCWLVYKAGIADNPRLIWLRSSSSNKVGLEMQQLELALPGISLELIQSGS